MICPTCKKEFYKGTVCPRCGSLVATNYVCPQCRSAVTGNFCQNCGAKIKIPTPDLTAIPADISDKNKWVAFFLCLFLGELGIHRFYVGKIGTGILWIFITLIALIFGLWWVAPVVDLIFIVCGKFKDKYGLYLM